ncbi:MAG: hypothetical protein H0T89_25220 [Deltaproteobacteria bacterium]|nr:hypothetical protein [Deltaproteobacteria bacterium]MDQ3297661.1 hypothetical protein [Myxococcota bacterium]
MRATSSFCLLLGVLVACGDNSFSIPDASGPPCSDGVDNDGDGTIDFPDDLGCENEVDESEDSLAAAACQDNRDNDGDGLKDYPNDPGCPIPLADSEEDDCPNGPACPQCADGMDNDNNGMMDYPNDPGCIAAGDGIEFIDNPVACGAGLTVKMLPGAGTDMGTLAATSTSSLTTTCGGGAGAHAIAYVFHLSEPKVVVASTDDPMTNFDSVLDLRSAACVTPAAHLVCNDDISATNEKSRLTRSLPIGTYYLIVEGRTVGDTGTYGLKVEFFSGEGTTCNLTADCGPGLLCRIPAGSTAKVCTQPVCNDTLDDDGDGKIDFPADPGCTSATDDTENDICGTDPTNVLCPKCSNGIDDDADGDIDYPADLSCVAASTNTESCPQSEPLMIATTPQTVGTTVGAVNDYTPPPGSFNGHACSTTSTTSNTAPDVAIQLDVPAMTTLSLRLSPVGFNSSHILLDASCSGTPIDCHDNPNNMVLSNVAAGRYYLIVDGFSTASGTFTLNTTGTIVNGESCESALAQSGAITCGVGYACSGTAGTRTCQPAQCNDGLDNNSDGLIDYPADPGCSSSSDGTEDTVCPGASCPICSDGLDNDGDLLIDYPADTGCLAASANNEGCAETDAIVAITTPTTNGTLVGATDDHDPRCVTTNLPDKIFTLDIPTTLQSLDIDTEGSVVDTVLSFMNSSCAEPSIACDDDGGVGVGDSLISRNNVAAGSYTIAVDSDSTTLGTFIVNVVGVIIPGGSCEGSLFQAGVLVCPTGFGCNGASGSRKCTAAQCQDGIDNNGDGRVDFPNDPSCDSTSDNTEVTVCPGATCPVCSDTVDNDNDGRTDYPADSGCSSAAGATEGCVDLDAIAAVTTPLTTGTLVGASDDHDPSCVTSNGPDRIYTLEVPMLQSLTIDTEGSVVNTVLSLMNSDCQEPAQACDDDGGVGTGDSLIQRGFLNAGVYTIAVDGTSATGNTYNLNVSGVIIPGGSCESPLVQSGVLTCSLGFACSGPSGSRSCQVAECLDGLDNNADGRTDFPADPGCDSFSDDTEATVCPGAGCPICSDGVDNDGDGATDYPADQSCLAASSTNEACTQSEPIGVITQGVTTGNTAGQVNDYAPTCGSSTTHTAPDLAYQLDLPAMATLTLNVTGFDSTHSLLDATCGGTPVACSDPALMTRTNVPAGTYYLVIDGFSSGNGAFTLTTSGTVAVGGSCEGALFQSGAFTCTSGHACAGASGSRTCVLALCNDGLDNDSDNLVDFPNDPGCASASDHDEADDCSPTIGASCPVCSNALDDDSDSASDFPADFGCASAGGTTEVFCAIETTPSTVISTPQTTGSLAAPATDNYEQTCQTSTGNDRAFGLQLPVPVATLTIDTIGSTIADTVLSLWDANCASQITCDDDSAPGTDNRSLITQTNVPAGNYAIQVDGFGSSNNGSFLLNVRGTVATGTDCTSPMFTAGVLVCPTGTTCTAGTCQ